MYFKHKVTGDCVRIDNLSDWEVVADPIKPPEPHWQDVTGECAYTNRTNKLGVQVMQLTCGKDEIFYAPSPDYRLRKVQVWNEDSTKLAWAFLVERKVE